MAKKAFVLDNEAELTQSQVAILQQDEQEIREILTKYGLG